MQDVRLLSEHFTSVKNSYNRDKRERQLESIEDKVPGGMLNYVEESFFMNGNIPSKDMVEVVKISRELEKEKSNYKIEGNRVETLEREEIWQRKMQLLDNAVENTRKKGDRWGEVNVGNIEVDAEYYELGEPKMLEKLKDIASHGGKVRVLMDSGRLAYKKPGVMDASQIAYRMETLSELQSVERK
jgi:vacuolar-type H+-ATPase subunit I/STV1